VRVRFKRWISCAGPSDRLELRIGGILTWATAYAPVNDAGWVTFDTMAPNGGNNPALVVEFRLVTDANTADGGWQIDDVALVTLHDAAPATSYGVGTPGTGGLVPTLGASAPAVLGTTIQLQGANLLGNSFGILALNLQPANVPALGVQVLVEPVGASLPLSPTTAGGTASWPFVVPNTPALDNVFVYAQAFGLDGGSPGGLLSASAGLRFRSCLSAP